MKNERVPVTFEEVLSLSPKKAEALLSSLSFREQMDLVLSTPWQLRAKLITLSPVAEGLVKNMPPQELFLTLKAVSPDEAVDLLSYAKPSQIQFLFDIDAWRKDRIAPERFAAWIVMLFETSEDKVAQWLSVADFDFLVAALKKFVRVVKLPDDADLTEARDWLPPYTLDDTYFVEFLNKKLEFYFRRIIEIVRELDEDLYYNLMEALIWELPSQVEEMAYRWRRGRLADCGIPDYFDALDIYAPISVKRLRRVDPKYLPGEVSETEVSDLPAVRPGEGEVFSAALSRVKDPAQRERLKKEFAWVINKVVMVDHINIDEISQVEDSVNKVIGYLNIGVEYLAGRDPEAGARVLETYFLEDMFRLAHTLVVSLRKKAREIESQEGLDPRVFQHLDEPFASYLRGIKVRDANKIKLFVPERLGTEEEYRWFRELSEVRFVEALLEEVGYWGVLIQKAFGSPTLWIAEVVTQKTNFLEPSDITWSSLILTALSNWVLYEEFKFSPIPKKDWPEVLRRLTERKDERLVFSKRLKEALVENFKLLAQSTFYYDPALVESFVSFVTSKFEEEYAFADPDSPPDPRYVRYVLIGLD